jgi:hypothetical protein
MVGATGIEAMTTSRVKGVRRCVPVGASQRHGDHRAHREPDPRPSIGHIEWRAAFKVGVKPAQIARQFGLSQSDVRQALASR